MMWELLNVNKSKWTKSLNICHQKTNAGERTNIKRKTFRNIIEEQDQKVARKDSRKYMIKPGTDSSYAFRPCSIVHWNILGCISLDKLFT